MHDQVCLLLQLTRLGGSGLRVLRAKGIYSAAKRHKDAIEVGPDFLKRLIQAASQ